ncbi:hypothetical protein SH528x_002998 [Novipirellula sp. SH528]|uniref:hypothetical protein n=1 Tax=Novipirellula sp. SH528 TaxID=3454466 RepID=UPI003F9EFB6D
MSESPDFPRFYHRVIASLALGLAFLTAALIAISLIGLAVDISSHPSVLYIVRGSGIVGCILGFLRPSVANSALMFLAHALVP